MFFNGRVRKNRLGQWCAFELIVRHGIVDLSPSPHTLAIYLEFVHACGAALERLKSVNVKMTMFVFIIKLGFPVMAIIVGYEAQSTPFP
jgi:hypothetical protein